MRELFRILEERARENKDSMLVTIVAGSGSLPRTTGAYMAVGEDGRIYGTIGGGNFEYQATCLAEKLLKERRGCLKEYNLAAEQAAELGMVCGGQAKVLFYYLNAKSREDMDFIEQVHALAREHRPYWLLFPLAGAKAKIATELKTKFHRQICFIDGTYLYAEQFSYDGTVYIFGGGHLAQETVPVLSHLGFRCVVLDDREEFSNPALFPGADEVIKTDFTKLEELLKIQAEDYLVVMTRGHLMDAEVERFALKTKAGYIGVVGSRKKTKFVRDKLLAEGFSPDDLSRVTAPIGLPIMSETPAEIAISIAGQLILHRAKKAEIK